MFNSNIIDVAIGLVFIFLLLSLICSAAHELIEMLLKQRAANLEKGIQELAGNDPKDFVSKLYSHGLINSLYAGTYEGEAKGLFTRLYKRYIKGQDLPSYIPSRNFALAVIDLEKTGADLPGNVKQALQAFRRVAGDDVALLQQHIETWFNSSMDRVSGWYKRRSQWIVLVLGLAAAIAVNADCIEMAKRLSTDTNLRQSVERMAETAANANAAADKRPPIDRIKDDLSKLDGIGLPLGWGKPMPEWTEMIKLHWAGWLLTALAISLGAPFWFDILNKIMVIRSTVKPAEKSGPEGSKDSRPPARQQTAVVEMPVVETPAADAPGGS
jgi:hypothetical protein